MILEKQCLHVSNSLDKGLSSLFNIRMQSSSSLLNVPMYTK